MFLPNPIGLALVSRSNAAAIPATNAYTANKTATKIATRKTFLWNCLATQAALKYSHNNAENANTTYTNTYG